MGERANSPAATAPTLRIRGLRSREVGPIDLELRAPECACLSGPSGAGKTLLLRALADLDPHEGEVWLEEAACSEMDAADWRRHVGWLPAESQWWYERVGEHMPAELAPGWLEALGFDAEILESRVSRLSTGERQRLALLRLLANRPRVLLLDEPTASLDPKNMAAAERLIASYRREHHASVLWVSHNLEQIQRVAQRHLVLRSGQLSEAALA